MLPVLNFLFRCFLNLCAKKEWYPGSRIASTKLLLIILLTFVLFDIILVLDNVFPSYIPLSNNIILIVFFAFVVTYLLIELLYYRNRYHLSVVEEHADDKGSQRILFSLLGLALYAMAYAFPFLYT